MCSAVSRQTALFYGAVHSVSMVRQTIRCDWLGRPGANTQTRSYLKIAFILLSFYPSHISSFNCPSGPLESADLGRDPDPESRRRCHVSGDFVKRPRWHPGRQLCWQYIVTSPGSLTRLFPLPRVGRHSKRIWGGTRIREAGDDVMLVGIFAYLRSKTLPPSLNYPPPFAP